MGPKKKYILVIYTQENNSTEINIINPDYINHIKSMIIDGDEILTNINNATYLFDSTGKHYIIFELKENLKTMNKMFMNC